LGLTDGVGASHILELGGPGTFDRSLKCLAAGGHIAQIGVLTGFGPQPKLWPLQAAYDHLRAAGILARW